MKRSALISLTVASIKMYFRNFIALFFTLFIPVLLIVLFGLLGLGNNAGSVKIGVVDYAHNQFSGQLTDALGKVEVFKVTQADEATLRDQLGKGKIDLELIISDDFGRAGPAGLVPSQVKAYYNQGRPQTGQEASLIVGQIIAGFNSQVTHTQPVLTLATTGIKTNNLSYFDFLMPGILAMSVMQLGIFSVAFAFIAFKTTGALRRLKAAPVRPINFIIGQAVTRLIVGMLQVVLLLGLGVAFFHMHLVGSIFDLLLVAVLGTLIFLSFGFAVAGWAHDENQAAPVANIITFPMLFLSGVFFPRDGFPHYLKVVTNYLPLTYLADSMRRIANEGASLWTVRGDLLGLVVWGLIGFAVAVWLFSWE